MAIYLHIGLNKTGSSSAQVFCCENRSLLRKHGLLYPESGVHDSAHYGVSRKLLDKPANNSVALAETLDKEIIAALRDEQDVLVSSEYFFLATDEQVASIKDYFAQFGVPVKVIVYLRRHDLWIKSLFNQVLKTASHLPAWDMDIRDYFIFLLGEQGFEIRYPRILERWATCFDRDNLIVRPFEHAQFTDHEYIWDFLGCIKRGLPEELRKAGVRPVRVNESVDSEIIRLIGNVRTSGIDNETKNVVTARLLKSRVDPAARAGSERLNNAAQLELPLVLRRSIVRFFADDYRLIAGQYLQSPDQPLFRDPVV